MNGHTRVDTLVRGPVGFTDRVEQVRVTHVSPFGWVAGVNADGGQRILYPGFEVLEGPRPVKARTDVPARLQT